MPSFSVAPPEFSQNLFLQQRLQFRIDGRTVTFDLVARPRSKQRLSIWAAVFTYKPVQSYRWCSTGIVSTPWRSSLWLFVCGASQCIISIHFQRDFVDGRISHTVIIFCMVWYSCINLKSMTVHSVMSVGEWGRYFSADNTAEEVLELSVWTRSTPHHKYPKCRIQPTISSVALRADMYC